MICRIAVPPGRVHPVLRQFCPDECRSLCRCPETGKYTGKSSGTQFLTRDPQSINRWLTDYQTAGNSGLSPIHLAKDSVACAASQS